MILPSNSVPPKKSKYINSIQRQVGDQRVLSAVSGELSGSADNFEQLIADDCNKASAALGFILAQEKIGSEIVDNLNASIHLRAVLTDLFLYGEAKEPLADESEDKPMWEEAKS